MATKDVSFAIKAKNKTKTAFSSVTAGLKSIGTTALKIAPGLGLGGAATAAALALIGKGALDAADRTQKLGQSLGFATETLSRLKLVSELTGSNLETTAKGMKKMQETVEDANDGLSSAKLAIDKLGLSAETLKQQKPEEAFETIVKGLAGVTNQSEKMAIAGDIFGRAGADIVRMANEGAEGLRKMFAEADRLNTTLSQTDADNMAAANDAITKTKFALGGVTQTVTAALAPTLTAVFNFASTGFASMSKDVSENRAGMVSFVKDGILKVVDSFGLIVSSAGFVSQAYRKIQVAGLRAFAGLLASAQQLNVFLHNNNLRSDSIFNQVFKDIRTAIGINRDALNLVVDAAEASRTSFSKADNAIVAFRAGLEDALDSTEELASGGKKFGNVFSGAFEKAQQEAVKLNSKINQVSKTASAVSNAVRSVSFTPSLDLARSASLSSFSGGGTRSAFTGSPNSRSILTPEGLVPVTRRVTISRPSNTGNAGGFTPQPSFSQAPRNITVNLGGVVFNGAIDQRTAQQLAQQLAPELKRQLANSGF